MEKEYKLRKISDDTYNIPLYRETSDLLYIKNLVPNKQYALGMNDLYAKFLADNKGVIYWNDKKSALPLGLAPDVAWTINGFFGKNPSSIPVGVFKSSDDMNPPVYLPVILGFFLHYKKGNPPVIVRERETGTRWLEFKNNAVSILPETKSIENFKLKFSGIGVL